MILEGCSQSFINIDSVVEKPMYSLFTYLTYMKDYRYVESQLIQSANK
jgi:hypothetical protein